MLGADIITSNTFLLKVTIETQFMDDTMDKSDFSTLMDEVLAMDKTPTAEAEFRNLTSFFIFIFSFYFLFFRNLTSCKNTNLTDLIAQMMPTMEDDKVIVIFS